MMRLEPLFRRLRQFRQGQDGTVAVETMLVTPMLILGLFFAYEAYGLYRQQSLRDKATYTVADILSRETAVVDDGYIDNVKLVFDLMSETDGETQLRISAIRYRLNPQQGIDEFDLRWSEVRGDGSLAALTDDEVRDAHDIFPIMADGEEIIYVETRGAYRGPVATGVFDTDALETRMFVRPRFAPQICFEGICTPVS